MGAPEWVKDAIFYQIFPDRFARAQQKSDTAELVSWDSEPTPEKFFGGDFLGIERHLDHVLAVGANALYLTPIFKAETNHRYDAVDYFSTDPLLGDIAAFRRLLKAAHERGIRVVLDAVLNHCGIGHPAFDDVRNKESDSQYVNWFYVDRFPVEPQPIPNYKTCSGCYYLPKWNVYNPEVREHHYAVARKWLDEGIDGWRLDVPYFINKNFWREFRNVVKSYGDDRYIVAEEWREPEPWLEGDIADGTMNYTLRDLVLGFTADGSINAYQFAEGMNALATRIPADSRAGMLNLVGSHDTERLLTRHNGDVNATSLAFALMYASEGAPMVYYGDEVGMEGANDPGCRGGMVWAQSKWVMPIFDKVRELARIRNANEVLRRGSQTTFAIDPDTVLIERTNGSQKCALVAHRGEGFDMDTRSFPGPPLDTRTTLATNDFTFLGVRR